MGLNSMSKTNSSNLTNLNVKEISISVELFDRVSSTSARKFKLTPDQLVAQLLEKELEELDCKEIFSPGLKWDTPRASLVIARIPEHDYPKIQKWLNENSPLELFTGANNQLFIHNLGNPNQEETTP
jgi:hypothetical protein